MSIKIRSQAENIFKVYFMKKYSIGGNMVMYICNHNCGKKELTLCTLPFVSKGWKLSLVGYIRDAALWIAKHSVETNLVLGRLPDSVAAAEIYMAIQDFSQDNQRPRVDKADGAGVQNTLQCAYKNVCQS
ncbi:unnamed protein product [Allacma fusca]|uniref:Transcription factor TFIIB cyclin-like domain-containing protein n=1 Tax=Allacma fusca TaxID=39272 RepID=A0A8J2P2G6_9HEXA|nr:unnamed protein product [Allacma fusca]